MKIEPKRILAGLAALLAAGTTLGAELTLTLAIPRIDVSEYHRPYVAVWVEDAGQQATNLAVWYAVSDREGAKWLADLRQWWRRSGRDQSLPIDGVTGATRPAGQHILRFDSAAAPLSGLAPGEHTLVVEAVREVGGREVVRIPFTWPVTAAVTHAAQGKSELGAVSLALVP